jgi:predicted CoA-binding protein
MKTSEIIQTFLDQPAIAVVGASREKHHFGNAACRTLRDKGYRVYPIHRRASEIDGTKCYARFEDLPERVGGVLIVVPPWEAIDVIRNAAAAGITRVWLQQGAQSPEALKVCAQLGVEVVDGECILMFAHPTGVHKMHQVVRRVFQSLPA